MSINQNQWPQDGWMNPQATSAPERRSLLGGLWNAWTLLTGPGDDVPQRTIEERARLGRARASSTVIFGLLLFVLLALPLGLQDPTHSTLFADAVLFVAILIASVLNRLRATTAAGWVLVLVLLLAIVGAVAGAPKLDYIYLPAFDLLAIPVVVAALVLPLRWVWVVGAGGVALIAVDIFYQPRSDTLTSLDGFVKQFGIVPLMLRPIILVVVIAILVFLFGSLLQRQIQRADRAEEIAELERRQLEQRRQLEMGVQQLLETHVRLANGDYSARANLMQDNQLWQVGASLNNLIVRLQRAGQAEYLYRRTEEESRRLVQAIDQARAGRHPFWPAPSGTPIDMIIERISGRERQPLPPGYTGPEQQISGPASWNTGRQPSPYAPANDVPSQFSRIPPMPDLPNVPGNPPATGPLDPQWGQRGSFSNPNPRADIPENPWFMPPEEPRS